MINDRVQLHRIASVTDAGDTERHVYTDHVVLRPSEAVVAVDYEAFTVYNLRSSEVVFGYTVPPYCKFLCAPCCYYVDGDEEQFYVTWAVVHDLHASTTKLLHHVQKTTEVVQSTELKDIEIKVVVGLSADFAVLVDGNGSLHGYRGCEHIWTENADVNGEVVCAEAFAYDEQMGQFEGVKQGDVVLFLVWKELNKLVIRYYCFPTEQAAKELHTVRILVEKDGAVSALPQHGLFYVFRNTIVDCYTLSTGQVTQTPIHTSYSQFIPLSRSFFLFHSNSGLMLFNVEHSCIIAEEQLPGKNTVQKVTYLAQMPTLILSNDVSVQSVSLHTLPPSPPTLYDILSQNPKPIKRSTSNSLAVLPSTPGALADSVFHQRLKDSDRNLTSVYQQLINIAQHHGKPAKFDQIFGSIVLQPQVEHTKAMGNHAFFVKLSEYLFGSTNIHNGRLKFVPSRTISYLTSCGFPPPGYLKLLHHSGCSYLLSKILRGDVATSESIEFLKYLLDQANLANTGLILSTIGSLCNCSSVEIAEIRSALSFDHFLLSFQLAAYNITQPRINNLRLLEGLEVLMTAARFSFLLRSFTENQVDLLINAMDNIIHETSLLTSLVGTVGMAGQMAEATRRAATVTVGFPQHSTEAHDANIIFPLRSSKEANGIFGKTLAGANSSDTAPEARKRLQDARHNVEVGQYTIERLLIV